MFRLDVGLQHPVDGPSPHLDMGETSRRQPRTEYGSDEREGIALILVLLFKPAGLFGEQVGSEDRA